MLIRKQVQFTKRQAAAVRREAARRGVSEAAFIREAVERALGPAGKKPDIDRILAVAGRYSSGLGDISVEHDRYLEEIYRS